MIEENLYENYSIDFKEKYSTEKEAYYYIFNNNREIYLVNKKIPLINKNELNINFDFELYIGTFKQKEVIVANTTSNGSNFHTLFELYEFNHEEYHMATRAVLIRDWYKTHQYCGSCGTKTEIDRKDMMLKCPKCQQVHYPRIAPAIIVAINNNGKLLMAKHSYHKSIDYTILAGFVEPGENIEEAVHREVQEEVNIKVKNVRYMKSQSWPFPNSLMIGFTADYDSGEIKVDGDEIIDAKWFKPEEIKLPPSDISISSWLIENFIKTYKGDI